MTHAAASRGLWAERYVLDELTAAERQEFEEHFFACPKCAGEVRQAAYFAANTRALAAEQKRPPPRQPGGKKKKPALRAPRPQ